MNQFYEELELSRNCSFDDIKAQYRKLAKLYHPDLNPYGKNKFLNIQNAYDWLIKNHKTTFVGETVKIYNSEPLYVFMLIISSSIYNDVKAPQKLICEDGFYEIEIPGIFKEGGLITIDIMLDPKPPLRLTLKPNLSDGATATVNEYKFKIKWSEKR